MQNSIFSKTILIGSILWGISLWLFTNNQVYATIIENNGSDIPIAIQTVQDGIGYARFIKGSCTDYAASRRPDIFPSRDGKDRLFGGDAVQWYHNARVAGLETGKTPEVGAIAVYVKGRGASTVYGHVAIVEKVLDDESIEITDMNYVGKNKVTRRIVKSNLALGYIYVVKDSINLDKKYSGEDAVNDTEIPTNLAHTGVDTSSGTTISYVINNNTQADITTPMGGTSSSDTQEPSHQHHSDIIVIVDSSAQTYHNTMSLGSIVGQIEQDHHSYESMAMNHAVFMGSMMELSG